MLIGVLRQGYAYSSDRFCLRLPMSIHSSRSTGALGAISVSRHDTIPPDRELFLQGKTILIVQDMPPVYKVRARYCTERGAKETDITIADTCERAIEALQNNTFDVIILDMGLPIDPGERGSGYSSWAGLYVLEHIVLHNMGGVILIDSNSVGKDLNTIYEEINRSPNEYPNLTRLGKLALGVFLGIFPMQHNPTDSHFIELLRSRSSL